MSLVQGLVSLQTVGVVTQLPARHCAVAVHAVVSATTAMAGNFSMAWGTAPYTWTPLSLGPNNYTLTDQHGFQATARFTITRITDVHLRQLDTPDKDFRAFLARLVAWRGPALGDLLSSV